MSRFLTAPYKLTILASLLRCVSNECLMYDHTNFAEILGDSKFVNMKYKDISSEYKVEEPPHGAEIGGAFLLGWPEDTEMKKISAPRPTSINISASFWCHSKETTLYLYSDCNWSNHDFCSANGKGWHEDFWYVECSPSAPDPNYFIIRGNTKQKQQAVGYEYLHICTDGSTVPPKPTTTEITTTTSYTTTSSESTTVDSDSTTAASTSSTTSSSESTTVDSDSTTAASTSSTTSSSESTTVDSDSTTAASTSSTTSSSESTTVDLVSTSTTTSDETKESTPSTTATTGTATAESETTLTVTSTTHNPTTPEEGSTEEEPTPKTTTTEAPPPPDGGCGEPVCILGLTVTQFEIVVVSSLIVFLILVTAVLVPLFKRRRRTYVTFIKEARPYSVRRRRRIPGPDVPSRSLSERRRRGGNVNRDSEVRIPRVLPYVP
ncbi:uncharacterized protein [Macrobrachium rosenbergii]|uniref:uncharacterized protein n=1 Tax=Macrobrachium rosenbergii TaxID=79674 RepID=UPI0034D6FBEF